MIASAADQGDPSLAQCLQSNSDNTVRFGVFVGDPAPDDFEAYVKRSSGVPDATFDDPVAFRGGTLHAYCGKDDSGTVTFCETDWLSDDIQLGLFAGFDGITTDDTTAWLQANIDALLASVAAADATAVTPAAGEPRHRRAAQRTFGPSSCQWRLIDEIHRSSPAGMNVNRVIAR